jgi:antitoxin component YwqK of YwqJK toxin-antitoxin module
MKRITGSLLIFLLIFFVTACNGKGGARKNSPSGNDTITVPDTGFTGISKYLSGTRLAKEVTFRNGVKHGLMKTFYASGKVRQTFWYENGLRQDSAKWYFEEGQLFRTTPFKNDTVDGIQKQYYRTGRLKAKIGYSKGLRTPYIEEYTPEGKIVGGYPQVVINTRDEYKSKGMYKIILELSDKSTKVRFYRGDLSGGVFDTAHCEIIKTINGIGNVDLRKRESPASDNIGIIAEILTSFGNNLLVYKKIDLPYNDLN